MDGRWAYKSINEGTISLSRLFLYLTNKAPANFLWLQEALGRLSLSREKEEEPKGGRIAVSLSLSLPPRNRRLPSVSFLSFLQFQKQPETCLVSHLLSPPPPFCLFNVSGYSFSRFTRARSFLKKGDKKQASYLHPVLPTSFRHMHPAGPDERDETEGPAGNTQKL